MAKMTYGRYLDSVEDCCLIISNKDRTLTNYVTHNKPSQDSPMTMSIVESSGDDMKYVFDVDMNDRNHPDFVKNWEKILRGELKEWILRNVFISSEGLTLQYSARSWPKVPDDDKNYLENMVYVYHGQYLKLLFTKKYNDGLPDVRHVVELEDCYEENGGLKFTTVTTTKLIGERKVQKIELRSDDFGQDCEPNKEYAVITEY